MKVQYCGLEISPEASGLRPSLPTELLAGVGARYSRNKEGLDSILRLVDKNNIEKSVKRIFELSDYGHQSIYDMSSVALFIDDISLYAAMHLWYEIQVGSGQESSTRYIDFNNLDGFYSTDGNNDSFNYLKKLYNKSSLMWTAIAKDSPELLKIPENIKENQKQRMINNFVFDRSRVWLPISSLTNVMVIQSGRNWVDLVSNLLSHPFSELQELGRTIRTELELAIPRMLKHAVFKEDTHQTYIDDILDYKKSYEDLDVNHHDEDYVEIFTDNLGKNKINISSENALKHRTNRYSKFGKQIRMTPIKFGWKKISFAEIRDLNRHRSGERYVSLYPRGFYSCLDIDKTNKHYDDLYLLNEEGNKFVNNFTNNLNTVRDYENMIYNLPLGTQFHMEHVTTLNKFIYEAELRTGLGAHYKYAEHLRNCLKQIYNLYPGIEGLIFEGTAEPE